MTDRSLYERLGGVNAIAMVVDRFSDAIGTNPKLNVNPTLREWNATGQLPGLKFMRTLWICAATGGPFQYTGKGMAQAHLQLHITSAEFDEVGAEIQRALDAFNVPEREQQDVLAAIGARKSEVVHAAASRSAASASATRHRGQAACCVTLCDAANDPSCPVRKTRLTWSERLTRGLTAAAPLGPVSKRSDTYSN